MRAVAIAGVIFALTPGSALAQVAGQPVLANPQPTPKQPTPKQPTAKPKIAPAKPSRPAAKPASTPEARSAAALALSAEPVFDEGTYQRIKEALLSY